MRFQRARLRLGIAGKVYLGGLVIVLFGFILFLAIAWVIAERDTQLFFSHEIDEAMADMQGDLSHEMGDLIPLGDFLASRKDFSALVAARDNAGLALYLAPLIQTESVDAVTIIDMQGVLIAHVGSGEPLNEGEYIQVQSGVVEVVSNARLGGSRSDSQRLLRASYSVTLRDDQTAAPIGTVILGRYLDDKFLQLSMKPGRADRAIVYEGQVIASTLNLVDGKPFDGQEVPAQVLEAEQEGKPSGLQSLNTDEGAYLVRFMPLETPTHQIVGMYGAGVSEESLTSHRVALLQAFGIGFLVVLLAMSVVGLLLSRTLKSPVHFLQSAVKTLAAGDLSKKVEWRSNDELGDLAEQIEQMRQQLRQALDLSHHQQDRYAAAIHDMGVAAVFTDSNQRITSVNAMGEQLLKANEASLTGKPWHQVFVMDKRADAAVPLSWDFQSESSLGGNAVVRGRFPLRAHPELVVDMISSPVQLGKEVTGYVHVLYDASAQEQFARTKDDFVLNVAHELRGPLASLRVSVELLTEDYLTMSKRDIGVMLRTLHKVIGKFQGLVESLVDVGNIQAGRFRVHPLPVSVEDVIRDAVERVQPMIEGKSQQVETHLEGVPALVLADSRRITQVLVNLMTNASKYGPEECPIMLSTSREDGFICFAVTDQGNGIPPEDQSLVFERFFRVKRTDDDGSGIGIGLALAKGIVEAHGGSIQLRSQPGQGTTFWFTLPMATSPNDICPRPSENNGRTM